MAAFEGEEEWKTTFDSIVESGDLATLEYLQELLLANKHELDARNNRRLKACKVGSKVIVGAIAALELVCVVGSAISIMPNGAGAISDIMKPTERAREMRDHLLDKYANRLSNHSEVYDLLINKVSTAINNRKGL